MGDPLPRSSTTPSPSSETVCPALGASIPFQTPHALSVSLPTWADNVGWASGNQSIVDAMSTGYPRFFVHRSIQKLAGICLKHVGSSEEFAMLFPTARTANEGLLFLAQHASSPSDRFRVEPLAVQRSRQAPACSSCQDLHTGLELHVLVFPPCHMKLAKAFWQHAGMGISSRYAEDVLAQLLCECASSCLCCLDSSCSQRDIIQSAQEAKLTIRQRIADLANAGAASESSASRLVTADDVFLYPTGMSSIWHAHSLALSMLPQRESICFGFSYTDTIKILRYWSPGCHTFFQDPDSNLGALEAFLEAATLSEPIYALFCEFPSNPLLQSPNLPRLRELADKHNFLIVVDDTIGNFVNVNVLEYSDAVVTSMSKLFSGKANVMGGSLVLNPGSRHYGSMKSGLKATFVDDYYHADALVMELNCRDFASRVHVIDENTEAVCEYLRHRSQSFAYQHGETYSGVETLMIKNVFYPKWVTRENYDLCRLAGTSNFGPLFSLTFISPEASHAFYNALRCAKGPSLGTNFTLSCPYTILAHYNEREWAAGYGIEEGIVRVSVGMEDRGTLMGWIEQALDAAERTVTST